GRGVVPCGFHHRLGEEKRDGWKPRFGLRLELDPIPKGPARIPKVNHGSAEILPWLRSLKAADEVQAGIPPVVSYIKVLHGHQLPTTCATSSRAVACAMRLSSSVTVAVIVGSPRSTGSARSFS